MSNSNRRSRAITGFHRLGLVLAVPVFLGALGTAVSAWFSIDGPYVPDPKAAPATQIILKPQASTARYMTDDELLLARATSLVEAGRRLEGKVNWFVQMEIDAGPVRTFALYQIPSIQQLGIPVIKDNDPIINTVLNSIVKFEKRRGSVLLAKEQPILVGDILAQEDEAARTHTFNSWIHLTRGFDWQRIAIAGGIAAFAAFIYIAALALGWVIDGFL